MRWTRRGAVVGAVAVGCALLAPAPAGAAQRPDPAIATLLSLGSTLLPVGTGLALLTLDDGVTENERLVAGLTAVSLGASVGPSVGQWYARGGGDAWVTFILRSLGTGMMTTGIAVRVADDPDFRDLGLATAILGGTATTVLAVYDIATASRTARETRRASGFGLRSPDLRDVARCGPFPCSAAVTIRAPRPAPSPPWGPGSARARGPSRSAAD